MLRTRSGWRLDRPARIGPRMSASRYWQGLESTLCGPSRRGQLDRGSPDTLPLCSYSRLLREPPVIGPGALRWIAKCLSFETREINCLTAELL